jgi:hypothetical protein
MPHYYTVQEANARLPELTGLLKQMQEYAAQMAAIQAHVGGVNRTIRGNGFHNPAEDEVLASGASRLEEEMRKALQTLSDWNIELKDLRRGLVDFPALRQGRPVYLCWELGEPEVMFWHETTTGYAGRQPLDENLL